MAEALGSRLVALSATWTPRSPSLPPSLPSAEQGSRLASPGALSELLELPGPASAEKGDRAPPWSPRRFFSVELITPPYRGCRLPPPGKRGRGQRGGGEAPCRWLRRSASWIEAPKTEQVRVLSSAPARPTIAPEGSGAPASLQPRAHAGLRLPAAPGRRSCQHCCPTCNSCNPEAAGGLGRGCARGCV